MCGRLVMGVYMGRGRVTTHPFLHTLNPLTFIHSFNQIDLPEYESYEVLRENLLYAVSECGTGFGFA